MVRIVKIDCFKKRIGSTTRRWIPKCVTNDEVRATRADVRRID